MKRERKHLTGCLSALFIALVMICCAAALYAQDEECTWQTWVDSDSSDIMFNQMLYRLQSVAPNKSAEVIKYSGSTLWARTSDIDVYGDVMYVLNIHGLEIYDIANLTNPVRVKQMYLGLGSQTDRLQIHENYLYLSMYDRLYVFDITDPYNPEQLSSNILAGHISQITIRDNRAYIGMIRYSGERNNYPALYIFDITDPSHLQVIGKYESPASMKDCRSFVLSGDYIYSINHFNGLIEIISIADETYPLQVYKEDIIYPYDISRVDNYLYLVNRDTIRAYDITDPDTLVELHHRVCDPDPEVVEVYNGLIYTAHSFNGVNGVKIFSYNPASGFDSVGFYDSWYHSYTMEFRDTVMFLPEWLAGFSILNLADPTAPQKISEVLHSISNLKGLDADGDMVYMTNYVSYSGMQGCNGLLIVDAADKTAPELVSQTLVSGNPGTVAFCDTLAVLSECQPTNIFSVADPANPVFLSQYPLDWVQTKDNAVRDTFLYMIGGGGCLEVASIADPLNPYYIDHLYDSWIHTGIDITLEGDIAYIMAIDFPAGALLITADVSNPSHLVLLDELEIIDPSFTFAFPGHSCKRDDILYIGAGYRGLLAINIRDPADVEKAGEYQLWGPDP